MPRMALPRTCIWVTLYELRATCQEHKEGRFEVLTTSFVRHSESQNSPFYNYKFITEQNFGNTSL